jgi:hypothetical protein
MTVGMTWEVYGVREALAELRELDPKSRAAAAKQIKSAGGELVALGAGEYPLETPLSGMSSNGRLDYLPSKVQRGVQIQVGGRTPKGSKTIPVVTLVQKNAGGALYDLAGLRGGAASKGGTKARPNFIEVLDRRFGPAQRGLWRARGPIRTKAEAALRDALEDVAAQVNRKLVE